MANTTPSPVAAAASADDLVFLDEEEANEISYWEFINQSDADSDAESLQSIENGFVSWYTFPSSPRPRSSNSDLEIETQVVIEDRDAIDPADFIAMPLEIDDDCGEGEGEDGQEEEDMDDDDDDVGYGLDDELVPWNVSGKFGRERMRKLGKRFCSKMVNSKRNPYAYVKAGCVHGKHGLGMKA